MADEMLPHFNQSMRDKLDTLYITGGTGKDGYKGVLSQPDCTDEKVWDEFMQNDKIEKILRPLHNSDKSTTNQISSFRMVLHRAHSIKMSVNNICTVSKCKVSKCKVSKCKVSKQEVDAYFVLLWIPCNGQIEAKRTKYHELISVLNAENYFCNKLDKQCLYISGSKSGIKLQSLYDQCKEHALREVEKDHQLIMDIVIHQIEREKLIKASRNYVPSDDPKNQSGKGNYKRVIADSSQDQSTKDSSQEIHSFGFVWFKIGPSSNLNASPSPSCSSSNGSTEQPTASNARKPKKMKKKRDQSDEPKIEMTANKKEQCSSGQKESVNMDLGEENKRADDDQADEKQTGIASNVVKPEEEEKYQQDEQQDQFYGISVALHVSHRLHQQPCDVDNPDNGVMNVELMGCDQCYRNLSLGVDTYHGGSWKNGKYMLAFQILVQCLLLPVFILLPLKDIITCTPSPRYRPQGISSDPWKDLDIIEQIPYDISAVWRRVVKRKIIGFPLSIILLAVIYIGPMLYRYGQPVANLSFFDCYGPAIFYGLWIVTIICWACSIRGLIAPKEHLLLYNKMIAQRPKNGKKPLTDFDTLTHLSEPQSLTVINYAILRGFLETKMPTHNLLSERSLKCCNRTPYKYSDKEWSEERNKRTKKWVFVFAAIILYFCSSNLENIQAKHRPVYVDKDKTDKSETRLIYGIASNITSCILLFTFIILWETMFTRIESQLNNVKHVTNLLIRNTYTEYIEFDYAENILSWIQLVDYVKRKGMTVFASLETPVFSLFCLCILSWGCAIYCIFEGAGLKLWTEQSLFSNSALATWIYLALFAFIQIARLLFYGYKFNRESDKQENAIRTQCSSIGNANLMQIVAHDELSKEHQTAMQSAQQLLISLKDHREIVPTVFGIKVDKLTSKVVISAVLSAIPTAIGYIVGRIEMDD